MVKILGTRMPQSMHGPPVAKIPGALVDLAQTVAATADTAAQAVREEAAVELLAARTP